VLAETPAFPGLGGSGPASPLHPLDPIRPGAQGDFLFVLPRQLVVGDVSIIHLAAVTYAASWVDGCCPGQLVAARSLRSPPLSPSCPCRWSPLGVQDPWPCRCSGLG
jgi:hypothetical protein